MKTKIIYVIFKLFNLVFGLHQTKEAALVLSDTQTIVQLEVAGIVIFSRTYLVVAPVKGRINSMTFYNQRHLLAFGIECNEQMRFNTEKTILARELWF
jgi:hypothetical protein